jgi:hypothetical protein
MEWVVIAGMLLFSFMPFLVSLFGKAPMPRMLCSVCGLLTMLLSVAPYEAVLPWTLGMAIAVISVCARIRNRAA